jgi:hypothetical protein
LQVPGFCKCGAKLAQLQCPALCELAAEPAPAYRGAKALGTTHHRPQ